MSDNEPSVARASTAEPLDEGGGRSRPGPGDDVLADAARRRSELFVDTLAHELRGPLQAAMASLEVIKAGGALSTRPTDARALERLERSLRRIQSFFDSARELSLTRGAGDAESAWTSLSEILSNLAADLQPLAALRGVALELQSIRDDLEVDGKRIEVALRNLLTNAIKYSDPGEGTCWARLHASVDSGDSNLVVAVHDNGVGIAAGDLGHVFERKYRAGRSSDDGTGLGLAIVHEAVHQMGGKIRVESELGIGSCFTLILPRPAWRVRLPG